MKRFAFCMLATGALIAVGSAGVFDAISLKRTPKVGDKVTYSLDGSISINGMDATITAKGTELVTAVGTDGTFTSDSTQSDLMFNGQPGPPQDTPTTQVENLDGEIISVKGPGAESARLNNLLEFYAPTANVNVGDTWTRDVKPKIENSVPLHIEGKLIALEKVGNFDTAKVEETVKETATDGGSVKSTIWLNTVDGTMVKSVSELTNVTLGPVAASSGKFTLTRTTG